jgi:aspartyl-tRNA(Asn)/glutamyl-tRNA(Gln) amidotransferase subunit A
VSELWIGTIVDQLRSNLRGAGIELGEAELHAMVEKGYLKPVLAFELATKDLAVDLVPEYLSAWGYAQEGDDEKEERPAFRVALPPRKPRIEGGGGEALDLPIHELAPLLASGELSPVGLVEEALARIEERGGLLNSFQQRLDREAREAARVAEKELRAGRIRGPLHGIPIAIKDNLDLEGSPTRAGSIILGSKPAVRDSTAVARLKEAGAVIVGKTRMSEFAYSPGSNNDHYGSTRNPAGLERDTGGSSSGSAAAVADHMVPAALGTDTGGSIRIPASFCGLVGLKPTYGRLSLAGGVSLAWSLDHLGPLTRSVEDAAIILDALSGYDPRDARTRKLTDTPLAPGLVGAASRGLAGTRIGVLRDDGSGRSLGSDEALAAWKAGLDVLAAAGAVLVDLDLVELQSLRSLNSTILAIEAATFHLPTLRSRLADYGDFLRLRLLAGLAYGPTDFIRAQQGHLVLRHRCDEIFDRIDVLSMPTMAGEAPCLGTPARLTFTSPFNLLGWPAISIPSGRGKEGLPLGMQLVAKPWDEAGLLQVAAVAEAGIGYK